MTAKITLRARSAARVLNYLTKKARHIRQLKLWCASSTSTVRRAVRDLVAAGHNITETKGLYTLEN